MGLRTDGFSPFAQFGQTYPCLPVILIPCNLLPWVCMKNPYMFLSLLIPCPKSPKGKFNIYMQPLIKELKHLWNVGVETYDISKKQNFIIKAVILWTINDFPTYEMLSRWITAGRLACPYCVGEHKVG